MSVHSSKIQRTIEELAEFDFKIRCRPGNDNEAANYLSRAHSVEVGDSPMEFCLPKEFKVLQKIDGGGDSLFQAVIVAMHDTLDDDNLILPICPIALRIEVVMI